MFPLSVRWAEAKCLIFFVSMFAHHEYVKRAAVEPRPAPLLLGEYSQSARDWDRRRSERLAALCWLQLGWAFDHPDALNQLRGPACLSLDQRQDELMEHFDEVWRLARTVAPPHD
jgi:hypothetical protein